MWTDDATALDILNAARRIREFVAGLTRAQFDADLRTQSAVLHQIIILGEAVKRLSDEFRQAHPTIPWSQIAGMRDRCAHGCDNVDLERVWEVTRFDAPQLAAYLGRVLPKPPLKDEGRFTRHFFANARLAAPRRGHPAKRSVHTFHKFKTNGAGRK